MSLSTMSPNIPDGSDSPSRKRSHQEYLDQNPAEVEAKKVHLMPDNENNDAPDSETRDAQSPACDRAPSSESPMSHSPMSLLTDTGSNSTATRPSLSPNQTPLKANTHATEPMPRLVISLDPAIPSTSTATKRKRLTPEEREEKAKADALRKQEKEEQKAAMEAKKQAQAEEREKRRKQKEAEDKRKAEEKERKRREKEEEEKKMQEAKERKERAQPKLKSFFTIGTPSTPKKAPISTVAGVLAEKNSGTGSPSKMLINEMSEYDRIFKPFFIKENVVIATTLYGPDEKTKEAKSKILDDYLSGTRGPFTITTLNSSTAGYYFHLPFRQGRGCRRPAVRKIVSILADADIGDMESLRRQQMLNYLKMTPMKFLGFREDVRPAYYGTATNIPEGARLSKLARNPLMKTALPLNYDYDSEAEWVDDGDGEDVDDLDEEEEELEEDEEMADFLDDSEDALPVRAAFSGGMEPESSGLCWENQQCRCVLPDMSAFRMEFILDCKGPIDPLSTKYWEAEQTVPEPLVLAESPKISGPGNGSITAMAPPPVPTDAFAALGVRAPTTANGTNGVTANGSTAKQDTKKAVVATEFVEDFKKAIMQYAKLSKLGIVEILSAEFEKCTKSQIKNSLEAMAERTGAGQHKTWKLKNDVAL